MKNNGKNPIDSSIHVNSDEDRVYVNSHEENVDVMKVVTWEASEEFDVGLSPFTDVQRNCEEIGLVDDIETHVIDDSTGYTSNNEIQNDESPAIDQAGQGLSISPGGTNWYTPVVEEVIKPVIGYVYPSLDVAESIYQKYAESAGFEVRRSTQKINPDGVIQNKYFVCSRFGLPLKKSFDSMVRRKHQRELRNSNIKRIGCTTSVKFRLMKGTTTYECYGFEEDHNHSLLRHDDMDLTRKGRQMKFSDQRFVHDAGISNMGATRAHKLHTSLRGGYKYGGPTIVDYQNYKRDCDNFVGRGDAKVLVDLMTKKRDADHNFFFEYNCVGSELHTIFWVDEVARFNYSEFGDVISFDATFRTNRHSMVFVPFTAVDNHNCNVVVGSALVGHEHVPNYKWLLQAFRKAHSKPPMMILTDQCPAMKQAIASVFPDSRHKLCIWHIMNKVPNKFSYDLLNNTTFKKQNFKLVWNIHISPDEFESRWMVLIQEFSLQDHPWLKDMFALRSQWIPAYFKELPMCCLMKTTSRSESANSFFNSFSKSGNNLFQFMLGFEFALEKQRREQRRLDYHTRTTLPKWLTYSQLERHACEIYTHSVFFEVQTEIHRAAWTCSIKSVNSNEEAETYLIEHLDKRDEKIAEYKVVRNLKESTVVCSCNHHRSSCRQRICDVGEDQRRIINDTYEIVDDVLDILRNDKEKLESFVVKLREMRDDVAKDRTYEPSMKRKERGIEQILGFTRPDNIEIHPATGIRNKGCGTSKRLIGAAEKAAVNSSRPKRMCRGCNMLSNHDIRNCPNKKK
ncbi:protein FAR1-RELATED SEQUENCE 5-like [Cynara cardunculus var. scolymus]|uniref:protein FAR1-RELATED SEQUENCE 5-like n=1 Tax=Cynara cardunculus var. scolymus TaxID=59895 RepID=UPI000D62B5AA|nr:protein FAR1-RELATED SEQUENCE 5-like [Cynara cardunculus var. scolymus]